MSCSPHSHALPTHEHPSPNALNTQLASRLDGVVSRLETQAKMNMVGAEEVQVEHISLTPPRVEKAPKLVFQLLESTSLSSRRFHISTSTSLQYGEQEHGGHRQVARAVPQRPQPRAGSYYESPVVVPSPARKKNLKNCTTSRHCDISRLHVGTAAAFFIFHFSPRTLSLTRVHKHTHTHTPRRRPPCCRFPRTWTSLSASLRTSTCRPNLSSKRWETR